jgi:adenylyl-sulfate kinase
MTQGWTLWFTGMHGSGKSTIAEKLTSILKEKNIPFTLFDGDELRKTISSDLGYSIGERNEHMGRVADLCKKTADKGNLVIASVASPTQKSREYARKTIGNILVVYTKCPAEVCQQRDVKGHYKKAQNKEKGFENFVGAFLNYEEPKDAEVVLDTDKESAEESAGKLVSYLEEKEIVNL